MRELTWTLMSLVLVVVAQAETLDSPPRKAQIEPEMAAPAMMIVRASFRSAARILVKEAPCQALFHDLNLNGQQALSRSRYQQARTSKELAICGSDVAAATGVGLGQVLICKRFLDLSPRKRTAIVIHEALHTAGLNEAPHDPDGMTSREITEMVKDACSL